MKWAVNMVAYRDANVYPTRSVARGEGARCKGVGENKHGIEITKRLIPLKGQPLWLGFFDKFNHD